MADDVELDVADELGASEETSVQQLTLYLPTRDEDGNDIADQASWIEEATHLLAAIGGGYTALPPYEGGWVNEEGDLIVEKVFLIYTYVKPDQFLAELPRLREFLHRLGRDSNQGEVAFQFDTMFYRITEFDRPDGG